LLPALCPRFSSLPSLCAACALLQSGNVFLGAPRPHRGSGARAVRRRAPKRGKTGCCATPAPPRGEVFSSLPSLCVVTSFLALRARPRSGPRAVRRRAPKRGKTGCCATPAPPRGEVFSSLPSLCVVTSFLALRARPRSGPRAVRRRAPKRGKSSSHVYVGA
jgi:hypothetical protein